jgi:hypothetical protein
MNKEVFCKMNAYNPEEWDIISAETAQKAKTLITGSDDNPLAEIHHPLGVQQFGKGAHFIKKAFQTKHSLFDGENKEVPVPKATPQQAFDTPAPPISGINIPKPPNILKPPAKKESKAPEIKIPEAPKVIHSKEDHFVDVETYNQDVVDHRTNTLLKYDVTQEGNNLIVFGKSYTPMQLFQLDEGEFSELHQKLIDESKDEFLEDLNNPDEALKQQAAEIEEVFPAENPDEKSEVDVVRDPQKVKLRTGFIISTGAIEKDGTLIKGNLSSTIADLDLLSSSEFQDLLDEFRDVKVEKESSKQKSVEKENSEKLDRRSTGYKNRISHIEAEGWKECEDGYEFVVGDMRWLLDGKTLTRVPKEYNEILDEFKKEIKEFQAKNEVEEIQPEQLEASAEKLDQIVKETKTVEINKEEREARKVKEHVRVSRPARNIVMNMPELNHDINSTLQNLSLIESMIANYRKLILNEDKIKEILSEAKQDNSLTDGQILDKIYDLYGIE